MPIVVGLRWHFQRRPAPQLLRRDIILSRQRRQCCEMVNYFKPRRPSPPHTRHRRLQTGCLILTNRSAFVPSEIDMSANNRPRSILCVRHYTGQIGIVYDFSFGLSLESDDNDQDGSIPIFRFSFFFPYDLLGGVPKKYPKKKHHSWLTSSVYYPSGYPTLIIN